MSSSTSPLYQCPTCKSDSEPARNLVIFIDGTSNKPGPQSTNVCRLHRAAFSEDGAQAEWKQRTVYFEGIGGYDIGQLSILGRVKKAIYRELEMALAWNVEKNVMAAYGWLAENYRKGDRIYLFGFSRGAYQARALAAMIHGVGLLKDKREGGVEKAYRHYRSIDPIDPETRNTAIEFKRTSCWSVRVHFVGVWDTVSSLGLIKKDVHITASASVTNACHFRHALALDERRVKFLPEYFTELNTHHVQITTPRLPHGNVNEVWFAGRHSDVGGTTRQEHNILDILKEDFKLVNMPLLWMKREAIGNGLLFDQVDFLWDPDDVDFCRRNMNNMKLRWRFVEILPIRHQVSFTGTGKHKSRWHLFSPRSVIPHQRIHDSISSSKMYTPRAMLEHGIGIQTVSYISTDGLWTTEPFDKDAIIRLLTPLLCDPTTAMENWRILLCLLRSYDGRPLTRNNAKWDENVISGGSSHFENLTLSVIRDVSSNFDNSPELLKKARGSLVQALSNPNELFLPGTLEVVQFATSNEKLERRFIAHKDVIRALLDALECTIKSRSEYLFPLVLGILQHFINGKRRDIIDLLASWSREIKLEKTRLSLILEVELPNHLIASLKTISSLAPYHSALGEELIARIMGLATHRTGPVGSAAVEALTALEKLHKSPREHIKLLRLIGAAEEVIRDVPIRNVLDYLSCILPRLDAEVGSTTSNEDLPLPSVLRVGKGEGLDMQVTKRIVHTINKGNVHHRTLATLTFLKLCRCPILRESSHLQNGALEIFQTQLDKKETSLLAAYALKVCLKHGMLTSRNYDFYRTAQRIIIMFINGWFDDAVGQVEGCEIFRELMASDDLREQVIEVGLVETIIDKFALGKRHADRMGRICLDILGTGDQRLDTTEPCTEEGPVDRKLKTAVKKGLSYLRDERKGTQMKGVKILSSMALTIRGAKALEPSVVDIVVMLLPRIDDSPVPRSQLFGPTAVLHNLCKNETLRQRVLGSPEFDRFRRLRRNEALYPPGKSTKAE